jgi:hypothetical protein
MFSIGPIELLILMIVGLLVFALPITVIVLLVGLLRKRENPDGDSALISQLRDENQRLREKLEKT